MHPWHRIRAAAGVAAVMVVAGLAAPGAAAGFVGGPCAVTAMATSTGPVDVANTEVWHIQSSDQVSAEGTSQTPQTTVSAAISAFGFEIPIGSASSGGDQSISSDLFDASFLATIGRVFVVHGRATGAGDDCNASMAVVLDDVNPFLTLLGLAGSAATLVGGLGLLRAFRNPGRRVISGLVGLGLLGAGLSLVLQQTSNPDQISLAIPSSPWAGTVPSPSQIVLEQPFMIASAILALAVILLLPFPADLFNSTLEHNGGRIRDAIRRLPLVGGLLVRGSAAEAGMEAMTSRQHPLVIIAFLVLAAGLYSFLSPAFGPDASSLLTFGGILAALLAETWFTAAPYRALHRLRDGDAGALRVVPATLLVAGVCVVISRAAGFQPGYLYGLLLGFEFAKALPREDDGRAAAAGAAWLLGLGLISWFALGAVRGDGINPSIAQSIAAAVFASLVTAGLQGSAFGMLPLRFLHGEPLFRWSRLRWSILYVPGLLAFCVIILNPENGFLESNTTPFFTTVALFVGFALVSVAFWAWFRFRPGPTGSGERAGDAGPDVELAEPVIP